MATLTYDRDALWKHINDLPAEDERWITLRYAPGERGWACLLGESGQTIIANVPYMSDRFFLDVVEVQESVSGKAAGRTVWRAFERKTAIHYPADTAENANKWFRDIRSVLDDPRTVCEGAIEGVCVVEHEATVDIEQLLRDASLQVDDLKLYKIV